MWIQSVSATWLAQRKQLWLQEREIVTRELAAHTGELNKMLVENGLDDV